MTEISATEIIAIVSHKGGTGKTSMVQNLAYELGKQGGGKRVLVVDLDPQSNLTIGCGLDPGEERATVYQAMHEPNETVNSIIALEHYDILPADLDLALAEQTFSGHYDRNDKLRDVLRTVEERYDAILIDSPPSLGFFAFNSLTAATHVIIPLQCQPYAYRALSSTLKLIDLVKKGNRSLQLKAIVLTMYDKRVTLTKSVENAARTHYTDLVPQTVIPVNVSVSEATLDGEPVAVYAPNSAGAKAYHALAEELFTK